MAAPPRQRRFAGSDGGAAEMVGYLLMVGLLIVMGGVLFAVTTNIANGDAQAQSYAALAEMDAGTDQMRFGLVKEGPKAPYNLDTSTPVGNEVKIIIDGAECAYGTDYVSDGTDHLWDVGESITIGPSDCKGGTLSRFVFYSVTITLGASIAYQGDVQPSR